MDHVGRIVRTIDGENVAIAVATSNFDYAPFNRLRQRRNNGGAQTTFAYNAYGRLLTHVDPNGAGSSNIYNGFGELETAIDECQWRACLAACAD